jgi:hypothetical protein
MTSNLLKSRTIVKALRIKSNSYFLPRHSVYFCPLFRFIHQIKRKEKNNDKQKSYEYCTTSKKLLIFHNTNRWVTTPHDDDAFEKSFPLCSRWQRLFPTAYQGTVVKVMEKRKAVVTCERARKSKWNRYLKVQCLGTKNYFYMLQVFVS